MLVEQRVNVFSDGVRLSAVLVVDDQVSGSRPALIYSHGWSGAVNDRILPLFRRLAEEGFVGLALDHRGFAGSDGLRARCDPREQARDVMNAVSYLRARPDVDARRIIAVGASFGGSIVIGAGAIDPRIAAVVSMVPVGDPARWLRALNGEERWVALMERLQSDAERRATGNDGERVTFDVLLPTPTQHTADSFDPVAHMYPGGFPLENLELVLDFRPEELAPAIAPRPLVLIGVDDDSVVPVAETVSIHERAGRGARLVRLPDGDHLGPLGPHADLSAQVIRELSHELLEAAP